MNRRWIQIALTFVIIAAAAHAIARNRSERFDQVNLATLPELDYCELRTNPDHYHGKVVKIRGTLGGFMHGDFFYDERCGVKSYDLLDDHRTAVTVFEHKRTEVFDTIERIRNPSKWWEPVDVIAIGRFTREYPTGHTDVISDRTSFHFELFSIEPSQ